MIIDIREFNSGYWLNWKQNLDFGFWLLAMCLQCMLRTMLYECIKKNNLIQFNNLINLNVRIIL